MLLRVPTKHNESTRWPFFGPGGDPLLSTRSVLVVASGRRRLGCPGEPHLVEAYVELAQVIHTKHLGCYNSVTGPALKSGSLSSPQKAWPGPEITF